MELKELKEMRELKETHKKVHHQTFMGAEIYKHQTLDQKSDA